MVEKAFPMRYQALSESHNPQQRSMARVPQILCWLMLVCFAAGLMLDSGDHNENLPGHQVNKCLNVAIGEFWTSRMTEVSVEAKKNIMAGWCFIIHQPLENWKLQYVWHTTRKIHWFIMTTFPRKDHDRYLPNSPPFQKKNIQDQLSH